MTNMDRMLRVEAGGGARGRRHRLTLVTDPRFPGGTAGAVAEEVEAIREVVDLRVCAVETAMFAGRPVNPRLAAVLDEAGIALDWNPRVIRGDTVVFHNPSCLRFDTVLAPRISCGTAFVVTHENFLRPNESEGFDVAGCLGLIQRALVAGEAVLAPVSPVNRRGVEEWLAQAGAEGWTVADFDWFNICAGRIRPPNPAPRDRRGRHSRPGLEKFPPPEGMLAHFPSHAERCLLLGADAFLSESLPRHWTALPFRGMEVDRFLDQIDFFVYFTHPLWRESFGRAVAEAIAAGKLVITDPVTAETFGPGVIASEGGDVDDIIQHFLSDPAAYVRTVRQAQAGLARLSAAAFRDRVLARLIGEDAAPSSAPPRRLRVAGSAHARL